MSGYTTVTAVVKDAFGNLYRNATVEAVFVNQSGSSTLPLLGGSVFQTDQLLAMTDSFGNLSMILADNNQITPTPSQWRFNIRLGAANFNTLITITGASQNITAALQAASVPLNLSVPPATILGGPNTWTGLNTFTGGVVDGQFNSVVWVDGVQFTTLAAAYAALPSTGGVVEVPPNYSETLVANLVLSKPFAGFHFNGPATITMGANQVTMAGGIQGAFIRSICPSMLSGAGNKGVIFVYTGATTPFALGDSTTDSNRLQIENINVDISGAGNTATGLILKRIIGSTIGNVHVSGLGIGVGGNNQVAVLLDGTNNFCGDNFFYHIYGGGVWKVMVFSNGANVNVVNVVTPQGGLAAAGICLDFGTNSSANTIIGADIENVPTAIHFSSTAQNNRIIGSFMQSNTTDVLADSGSSFNYVSNTGGGAITLNNTNNYVDAGPGYGSTLLSIQGLQGTLTGNSADQNMFANVTIPTIPAGRGIRVKCAWNHAGGTASTVYKLIVGGSSIGTLATSTGVDNTQNEYIICDLVNNAGVQNAQTFINQQFLRTANVANVSLNNIAIQAGTSAVNFAIPQTLNVSFNVANTDQITPRYLIVERLF